MPVCLKCGWEILIGPGGCACTQAARHERMMEEAAESGKKLAEELLGKMSKEEREKLFSQTVDAMLKHPPMKRKEIVAQNAIRKAKKKLEKRRDDLKHEQEVLQADYRALQRKCTHPYIRKYSSMGEVGSVCDDCGHQT